MPVPGQPRRLDAGGRIDRSKPLRFEFDGRPLQGFQGDTLASALLAAGVDVVARSFKYGRPRGIVGHGAEEPNAVVQLGAGKAALPNQRATQIALYDGLVARSGASWRAAPLFARLARVGAGLMPAGFYYKTFMAHPWLWRRAEDLLRSAAGLGEAPREAPAQTGDAINSHCDVLVAGGGPAGIAAALAAARAGARVILADEHTEFGGSLLADAPEAHGPEADAWVESALAELKASPHVQLLPSTTVFGYYDHNFLGALEHRSRPAGQTAGSGQRQRLHRIRARQVVLATGAIERPLVFANNDVPGVMQASAVSTYLHRYGVAPGTRLLVVTAHDGGHQTALDWRRLGLDVAAVVDVRPSVTGELPRRAAAEGIEAIAGHGVMEALGRRRVKGALIAPIQWVNGASDAPRAELTGRPRRIDCDLIACSGGWSPAVHLHSQAGGRPEWNEAAMGFVPGASTRQNRCAGAVTGARTLLACLEQGARAGAEAAMSAGCPKPTPRVDMPKVQAAAEAPAQLLFLLPHRLPPSRAPRQFVDFQLDVTAADIELAAREGYRSVEHAKRYTALGFGTDQGKLGNVNGVGILAAALGRGIAETGTTMFRPPYTPVGFGALAGRDVGPLFDAERRTPMHGWHEEHGALWENVGRWKRPWYYPRPGETMQQAVNRECLAARNGVAMLDASTLGKIDVQGADAAEFLHRVYTGRFLRLGIGRCRYGLMLREDGTIFDDGVTARLSERRYLVHTTTGNAEAVMAWLELWRQTEWPELDVWLTSVTDHWATAAVVGPKARETLAKVCPGIDLSDAAFPFMAVREGHVAGAPARVFRISFSGELSFEVNVPAQHGMHVWEALMAAGEAFDISPYGTEAMHVLRAEKGFIIVGQDTDGDMTPDDMGLGWAVHRGKAFGFIGDRSLDLPDHRREDRLQFVGLAPLDGATVVPEGAQLLDAPNATPPAAMQGHVTSSYFSAALQRPIALAMLKGGRTRMGETVYCVAANATTAARVVGTVFHDPEGERQNV